jgi:hypothetical protein
MITPFQPFFEAAATPPFISPPFRFRCYFRTDGFAAAFAGFQPFSAERCCRRLRLIFSRLMPDYFPIFIISFSSPSLPRVFSRVSIYRLRFLRHSFVTLIFITTPLYFHFSTPYDCCISSSSTGHFLR